MLGDIDGLAGKMRRSSVAFRRSRVAVDMHEMLLELHRTNSGVDLQRRVEVRVVGAGKRRKKLRGPRPAVATISREPLVDL